MLAHVDREDQYAYGLKVAYGLDINEDFGKYNGNVEYQMAWDILRTHGVTQDEFKTHYDRYLHAMYDHLVSWSHKGEVFQAIVDAKKLVQLLKASYPDVVRGVLTGNAKKIATWKLEHAGYGGCFQFGMYGDDATNRIELAKQYLNQQRTFHGFAPKIIVIGDTIHDIRWGKP
jgi:phosphoglycolate phosphatase-like HAD superfamily hydrolase